MPVVLSMPNCCDSRERAAELADHLDRAIKGHQTGLDSELGLTFTYLLPELREYPLMRFRLCGGCRQRRFTVSGLSHVTVAVIEGNYLLNVVNPN